MRSKATNPDDAWTRTMLARYLELQAIAEMQISQHAERIARQDERWAQRDKERALERKEHEKEMRRIDARFDERFSRIDERFVRIEKAIAVFMSMLERLPDAVREKIGFVDPAR